MCLTSILQTNKSNAMFLYVLEKECTYQVKNIKKELLRNKYQAKLKEDVSYWNKKPVKEFFKTYKIEITKMLKEYPKVDMDGVLMLEGMAKKDMPFQKELIQAKLISKILDSNVILLPRFATNLLNNMFNVNLSKGSLADGLAALIDVDKYIEFKLCGIKNFVQKTNEAIADSDIAFVAIKGFDEGIFRRRLGNIGEGSADRIIFLDVDNGRVFEKNEESVTTLLMSSERIQGANTGSSQSLSVPQRYIQNLEDVNTNLLMDYDEYLKAKPTSVRYQGDVERKIVYASTNSEATRYLKEKQGKDFVNNNDGTVVRFGSNGRNKMISNKAKEKSIANGFTAREHNTAAANIDILFSVSELVSESDDRKGNPDVRIRRYEAPVMFMPSQKPGYAEMLVKISDEHGNTLYTVELTGIKNKSDLIDGVLSEEAHRASDSIINLPSEPIGVNQNILFQTSVPADFDAKLESISKDDIGKPHETIVFAESTPNIFQRLGFPNLPVEMYKDKLARGLFLDETKRHGHKNGLEPEIIRQVATKLADPLYVFRSATRADSLVAVYPVIDMMDNPVMVSFATTAKGADRIEINLISSIYGKKANSLQSWVEKGLLLYRDDLERKKPTLNVRLQLPSVVIGSTNTVLRKSQIVKETHSLKNNLIEIKFKPQN